MEGKLKTHHGSPAWLAEALTSGRFTFERHRRLDHGRLLRRRQCQIGRLHAKVTDSRRDHQHQLTAKLVQLAKVIVIEDLAVKAKTRGMGRKAFRRRVAEVGLTESPRQITYKANWQDRVLGRWISSTQASRPARPAPMCKVDGMNL